MARVHLTGGLHMEGPAGSFGDADLPGAQGRVAFALLVHERRPVSRDELAGLIWDAELPDQWNGALTAVTSKIRKLVSGIGLDGRTVVDSSGGTCAIVLPADCWVDLEDARRRLDRAEGALRHGDLSMATTEATVASAIYRRPLLAGTVSDWVDRRRREHDASLYRCYAVLADAWNQRGDHQLAATVATKAVELDPIREIGHRLLITAEIGRGDHGAALSAYTRCADTLSSELGIGPSPETRALVDDLLTR